MEVNDLSHNFFNRKVILINAEKTQTNGLWL